MSALSTVRIALIAAALGVAGVTAPADGAHAQGSSGAAETPRVGLALSGGGARGAAHIGVLRVLEQQGIPIDYIAGTSMGAVVGGLYAAGMSVDELEETITGFQWGEVFSDAPPRRDRTFRRKRDDDLPLAKPEAGIRDGELKLPTGFVQGVKFDAILSRLTLPVAEIDDFDRLPIPFRAVATDIGTGEMVIMDSGDLAGALRASMSIPAAFAAVERDGRLLVDGGITNNIPIDVVRDMGADIVIAVDISTPLLTPDKIRSVLSVTEQLVGFMTRTNSEERIATLGEKDILIVPDLGNISTAAFERVAEAIAVGEAAAEAALPQLAVLGRSADATLVAAPATMQYDDAAPIVDFVRVENDAGLSDDVLASQLPIVIGEPLDLAVVEQALGHIIGLGVYQNVTYRIVEEDGRTGVVMRARQKSWGPNYVKFGLRLSTDMEGSNEFSLGATYTQLPINPLGGEWRTGFRVGEDPLIFTEIHQPLDTALRYFVAGGVNIGRHNVNLVSGGDTLAEFRVEELGAHVDAGRELGRWGEARLGLRFSTGETDVRVGDPTIPEQSFNRGEAFARVSLDTLDNLDFPTAGASGLLEVVFSREDLGADEDFEQLQGSIDGSKTWGANTFTLGGKVATTYDGEAPIQNRFFLGGFVNLSGFGERDLSGQHAALVRGLYYRRVADVFFQPVYVGGSLEAGNVWEDSDDIAADELITAASVFLGADTPLGPFYLGYGRADTGKGAFYLYLGRLTGR